MTFSLFENFLNKRLDPISCKSSYKVVYSNKTSYDITKDDFELWHCSGHPFVSKFYFELPRPKMFLTCSYFYEFQYRCSCKVCSYLNRLFYKELWNVFFGSASETAPLTVTILFQKNAWRLEN